MVVMLSYCKALLKLEECLLILRGDTLKNLHANNLLVNSEAGKGETIRLHYSPMPKTLGSALSRR